MPQQPEAKLLKDLTEVPASWRLTTVIDAFLDLAFWKEGHAPSDRAREAVSPRLVELWAAQPAEGEVWLQRCRELYAKELACKVTRPELLSEALLQHGAAEFDKYGRGHWRFSEAGLLRGAPCGSAAERERLAANYLQRSPYIRNRCEELAERLVEAESPETARKRQKLEKETTERRRLEAELQKSQEEGQELRNRLAVAEAGSRELQERCEQLRQQLKETSAKAAVERSAMLSRMQVLREELKDMHKQRIRELELQQQEARDLVGPTLDETSCGQEPDLAEQLGCFMSDSIFKCDADYYLMGKDLTEVSQAVAADGTILKVAERPETFTATHFVDLHAGGATLRVTPDHPVRVPDARGELDKTLYLPAGQLKKGDSVILDSGEAAELTAVHLTEMECEVLKIVFEPDLPVAVFSSPPCIQSKGHNKKPSTRRAGEWRKEKAVVDPTDGAVSIPDTAVGSERIVMDLC